ncbi:MAG: M15 family metallopeptidase [Microbacterium sp.]|uniref:M15 family metallopeptidase n=1 Tax=Microbacterium sp. TaxID=51671 RepID=UPI002720C372|nr:M15 family metallopeptidase [Microbacterium sp.]MDO8382784.1 M15 family metallopeptidase [Microbacterium sp.]
MSSLATPSSARTRTRRILSLAAIAVAVGAAVGVLVLTIPVMSSGTQPTSPTETIAGAEGDGDGDGGVAGDGDGDGELTTPVSVFDEVTAVTRLKPELRKALRDAATDAAREDIEFQVNSGWRAPEYQERLLREAVTQYGSVEEAARWVATPATSPHVSGDAVDVGGFEATLWLAKHGAAYGLCQIYDNEPWHFELRPEAATQGCPDVYWDPTYDPRMQG